VGLFGALINPHFAPTARQLQQIEDATRTLGVQVFVANVSNDAELDQAFASLVRHRVGAFMVAADPYFDTRRDKIVSFAANARVPAIYHFREFALAGGLISYGPSITEMYKHAGAYIGRILHGAKPADLPVLQPTKFELVINQKTASALNLAIPNSMQLLADEVIE
jgi:putative ABC transport system substrate-binding protein